MTSCHCFAFLQANETGVLHSYSTYNNSMFSFHLKTFYDLHTFSFAAVCFVIVCKLNESSKVDSANCKSLSLYNAMLSK